MAGKYGSDHAGAYADILAAGGAITFESQTRVPDPDDPNRERTILRTSRIPGVAMEVKGDPREYERLKLVEKAPATLLFCAEIYGQEPPLGASCTWASERRIVKRVRKVAPDGEPILSRVVISR